MLHPNSKAKFQEHPQENQKASAVDAAAAASKDLSGIKTSKSPRFYFCLSRWDGMSLAIFFFRT
jgi:hypothetical protein